MPPQSANPPAAGPPLQPQPLELGRDALQSFEAVLRREWLVTNGIGGYAFGTVGGLNTRRYHGLLVAALRPPALRAVMISKLDATVRYRGAATPLACNEFADGIVDPHGYRHLESFRLEGLRPVWTWVIGDAVLEQRVWMAHGENTTYVVYRLLRAAAALDLEIQPLYACRDFHGQRRGAGHTAINALGQGFEVVLDAAPACRLLLERGSYAVAPDWYWNFKHRVEALRGLDAVEDLFRPAVITLPLTQGESAAMILTTEPGPVLTAPESELREQQREQALLARAARRRPAAAAPLPPAVGQLILAADQFIVERRDRTGAPRGHSVIAGYPWFGDWGRDTMIALPGLVLTTGRAEVAASILRTFAEFVSDGMLPNRFPDDSGPPEYNTVDATLWYFVAIDACLRQGGGDALRRDLYPVLKDILAWHVRGTRYRIGVDSRDGLLAAGVPGVQLTWMDAKCGDWVVTPRSGKCVEINALWINALQVMRELATAEEDLVAARRYAALAAQAAASFNDKFWFAAGGHLHDVIDGPEGEVDDRGARRDPSLRPNQIFAVSLPHCALEPARARAVVDTCARELWTPAGLRTLAPRDRRYVGVYRGGPAQRDGAYHQGTAWAWLLGPFAIAHYRVYGDAARARAYLGDLGAHLREGCVGQVSEIFDGDAPFAARGCCAQAWSVAELLRAWSELDER